MKPAAYEFSLEAPACEDEDENGSGCGCGEMLLPTLVGLQGAAFPALSETGMVLLVFLMLGTGAVLLRARDRGVRPE